MEKSDTVIAQRLKSLLHVVTHAISTPKGPRQEECDSKASLDYILRPCLKTLK